MDLDYKKLGLKCGLEIHQQLETNKLFCNCPSIVREDIADLLVKRRLRAVAGETGYIDIAAMHEKKKEKEFIYEVYEDTNCLVEIDESPPYPLNNEALNIVLQVSLMLNAKPVDEIQVMRKTVVDGSNTSGFQRTALISRNGFMNINEKIIKVPTVCIEEDAARIIKTDNEFVFYRLDRLGIPLIEIATDASIETADECKETAAFIGMVLRSTGKVKRGLGTIRQDVNVSIKNGARVEIKGAQDLRIINKLVEYECLRQGNLIELNEELKKLNAKPDKIHDITHILKNTDSKIIQAAFKKENPKILALKMQHFSGFLGKELQPGRRLGTELSDYAKMMGVSGLFHSDENLLKYGFSETEINNIKQELKLHEHDAFVLIADNAEKAEKAMNAVIERANLFHIPSEVRKANDDGTSSFLRPIPGASRMYPETDVPNVSPVIENIKIPDLIVNKIKKYSAEYEISSDLATLIVKNDVDFDYYISKYQNIKPSFIAQTLMTAEKEIKSRYNVEIDIPSHIEPIFDKLNKNEIPKEAVFEILVEIAHKRKTDFSRYRVVSEEEIMQKIKEIVNAKPELNVQAIMGEMMKLYRGKIDGKRLLELIQKEK